MKLSAIIQIIRPVQWLKNLMLFFPPFLGGLILSTGALVDGLLPVLSFCLASSATYVLNDICDRENDAHHQVKKLRPIPSGRISLPAAGFLAVLFLALSLLTAASVSGLFLGMLLLYLVVSACYSLKLKEVPIVDLFCISSGFLLRLQAGGEAFQVAISEWLFLSVFLLSLFLGAGKRLHECITMGEAAFSHRKSLSTYPAGYLDGALYLLGAAVLVTYTMYTMPRYPLVYTVPLCTFGLLRYILRVKSGLGGDPTESLLRDLPLLATSLIWSVMVGWSVYR